MGSMSDSPGRTPNELPKIADDGSVAWFKDGQWHFSTLGELILKSLGAENIDATDSVGATNVSGRQLDIQTEDGKRGLTVLPDIGVFSDIDAGTELQFGPGGISLTAPAASGQLTAAILAALAALAAGPGGMTVENLPILASARGADNGVAELVNGLLPANRLPALAINQTFIVDSQAAMLALAAADPGDVAMRTDIPTVYILAAAPATELTNWRQWLYPPSPVLSVNAKTGTVSLTTADIADSENRRYVTNALLAILQATSGTNTGDQTLSGLGGVAATDWRLNVGIATLTDAADITPDFSASNNFEALLNVAGVTRNLKNPLNPSVGQSGIIYLVQSSGGNNAIVFDTNYKFVGKVKPPLTMTANAVDRLVYTVRSATFIDCELGPDVG